MVRLYRILGGRNRKLWEIVGVTENKYVGLWEMDKYGVVDNPSVAACAVPPRLTQGRLKRGETLDEHSRNDTGLYMERSALCTCEPNPPCRIRDIPPLGKGGQQKRHTVWCVFLMY